jgi:hypothetical protein
MRVVTRCSWCGRMAGSCASPAAPASRRAGSPRRSRTATAGGRTHETVDSTRGQGRDEQQVMGNTGSAREAQGSARIATKQRAENKLEKDRTPQGRVNAKKYSPARTTSHPVSAAGRSSQRAGGTFRGRAAIAEHQKHTRTKLRKV